MVTGVIVLPMSSPLDTLTADKITRELALSLTGQPRSNNKEIWVEARLTKEEVLILLDLVERNRP